MRLKVVITGASGFIGRVLTEKLRQFGFDVVPVARRAISDFVEVRNYFETPEGDFLIHLAEEANRSKFNEMGTLNQLHGKKLIKVLASRFSESVIYISSGVVYGDLSATPKTETDDVRPNDHYSQFKMEQEKIVAELNGCILRPANLYGSGMSSVNVITDIMSQLSLPGPIRVKSLRPIRDFLYVEDFALAVVKILQTKSRGIYNVGSGIGTSIGELAQLITVANGQKGRRIIATQCDGTSSTNILEISKAKKDLGWWPLHSIRSQLPQLISSEVR